MWHVLYIYFHQIENFSFHPVARSLNGVESPFVRHRYDAFLRRNAIRLVASCQPAISTRWQKHAILFRSFLARKVLSGELVFESLTSTLRTECCYACRTFYRESRLSPGHFAWSDKSVAMVIRRDFAHERKVVRLKLTHVIRKSDRIESDRR